MRDPDRSPNPDARSWRWRLAAAATPLLLAACGPPAEPAVPRGTGAALEDEGNAGAGAPATAAPTPPPPRSAPAPARAGAPAPARGASAAQRALFAATNAERRRAGRPLFVMDAALNRAAQAHAADMARRRYFSHFSPEGLSPFQRLRRAGIRFGAAAENIAENASPAEAVAGWMRSPGHRQNLLNAGYRRIGLGAVAVPGNPYGNAYYVQVFTD